MKLFPHFNFFFLLVFCFVSLISVYKLQHIYIFLKQNKKIFYNKINFFKIVIFPLFFHNWAKEIFPNEKNSSSMKKIYFFDSSSKPKKLNNFIIFIFFSIFYFPQTRSRTYCKLCAHHVIHTYTYTYYQIIILV